MAYSREEFDQYVSGNLLRPSTGVPWGPIAGLALPTAGYFLGSHRYASGRTGWDYAFNALQHVEGGLPIGIGATFRASEFMSPLAGPGTFSLLPTEHPDLFKSRGFEEYISAITGKSVSDLRRLEAFKKGFVWKRGVGYLGDLSISGGPSLASNIAALSTGPRRSGTVLEWMSRVLDVGNPTFFTRLKETDQYLRPAWMPTGAGGSKAKLAAQYGNAFFSWAMGRMNLLLTSPFELEVMQEVAKKLPFLSRLDLGVKPGTGSQMLWRFGKKAAGALAAYHLVKYGDYLSREHGTATATLVSATIGGAAGAALGLRAASPRAGRYGLIGAAIGAGLGATALRHGPISGLAETYAGLQISRAKISDALGLTSGVKRTEDYFPGLTKPTTLVAAAGTGLLLGGTWDYISRLRALKSVVRTGPPGSGAGPTYEATRGIYEALDRELEESSKQAFTALEARALKQEGFSKLLTQLERRFVGSSSKGHFSRTGAGSRSAVVGAGLYSVAATVGSFAAGDYVGGLLQAGATIAATVAYAKRGAPLALAALAIPFLRTKETPTELQRIYSGQDPVAVRSGRWWEAGRTPYEGGRPYYRPHRVAMMRSGAHEAALFGSEEAYWETDPVLNPFRFLANPYERENLMWEQGYRFPVSKTPFEDFPVLGPLLAATIGRAIKPPRFMGREQWRPEQQDVGPRGMTSLPDEEPIQRVGLQGTIGEQMYRLTEISGLPGFVFSSLKQKVTGTESFFEKDQWATPSLVSGVEPGWWSGELGGMALLCIEENSIIQASRGCLPIKSIIPGDRVVSRDGSLKTVTGVSSRKETDLLNVVVGGLGAELKLTANHVLPIFKGEVCHDHSDRKCIPNRGKLCQTCSRRNTAIESLDCSAGEISPGDFVEVPLPRDLYGQPVIDLAYAQTWAAITGAYVYPHASQSYAEAWERLEREPGTTRADFRRLGISDKIAKEVLHEFRHGGKVGRTKRYVEITPGLAYLLGWYAAEGYVNKTSTCLTMHVRERSIAEQLGEIAHESFGANYGIYSNGENGIRLDVPSVGLSVLCPLLVPGKAIDKQISHRLVNSSIGVRAAFLRGYMSGDGFINTSLGKAGVSTSSKVLAEQSYLIGLSLGFHGYAKTDYIERGRGRYPNGSERQDTKRSYVVWAKETVDLLPPFLSGEINSLPKHGNKKSNFVVGDKAYFQVKEVSQIHGDFIVCDLAIEDLHYFTAEFITVHNSEGIRRYIPHKRNQVDYRNPLPSGLPSWLPGQDSNYFLDFSSAEIYSKIKEPWARLPGAGYAQLHPELKGVDPELYSPYHRYRILADVAPWSKEYGAYNRVMSKQLSEGRLTPDQALEVQAIRKRVQDVKKAMDFQAYRYDSDAIQKVRVRIADEVEPGVYTTDTFGSALVVMAGVNTSALSMATVARQQGAAENAVEALRGTAGTRAQMSDFLRQYVYPGAEVDLYVHRDPSLQMQLTDQGSPMVQAVISAGGRNLNRELLERGYAQEAETSTILDAKMATDDGGRAFGAFWERLAHGAETPLESFIPLAPVAKFMHQRTALEQYQRAEVYGKDVALWQEPVRNFLAPGLATTAWWMGWRGIPRDVRQKYMVDEYFDRLEYMKYQRLEMEAKAKGDGETAAKYSQALARTKVGADIFSSWGVEMALSAKEKAYFREFVQSPTAAERRDIANIVSPQMREMLQAQWARRAAEAAQARAQAGVSREGDLARINRFYAMRSSRDRSVQEMGGQALPQEQVPNPSWVGWDSKADIKDYKVKTVVDQGMNPQSFGIWRSDIERAESRPWVQSMAEVVSSGSEIPSPARLRAAWSRRMNRWGYRPPSVHVISGGEQSIEFRDNGRDRVDEYIRDRSILQF